MKKERLARHGTDSRPVPERARGGPGAWCAVHTLEGSVKNRYVLEFISPPEATRWQERDLEPTLIQRLQFLLALWRDLFLVARRWITMIQERPGRFSLPRLLVLALTAALPTAAAAQTKDRQEALLGAQIANQRAQAAYYARPAQPQPKPDRDPTSLIVAFVGILGTLAGGYLTSVRQARLEQEKWERQAKLEQEKWERQARLEQEKWELQVSQEKRQEAHLAAASYAGKLAVCIQDVVWFLWYSANAPGCPNPELIKEYDLTLKKDYQDLVAAEAQLAAVDPTIHSSLYELTERLYNVDWRFSVALGEWRKQETTQEAFAPLYSDAWNLQRDLAKHIKAAFPHQPALSGRRGAQERLEGKAVEGAG